VNLKKAKALRQAIRAFARAPFKGPAANDAYLRVADGPIRVDPKSPRAIYKKAKKRAA
jgi:hypothetical protein